MPADGRCIDDPLSSYLEGIGTLLRDKRQRASFAMYALGLLSDGERKSIEPIAARASGSADSTHAVHEKLIHFLGASPWADAPVRAHAARYAVDAMLARGPIRSWIVDDTGFLKQGKLSPGVQRQYTGSAGKTTNLQIGVSLVLATDTAHVAADFQLYIPESWANDRERCRRAYIPDDLEYAPKWCLALGMIERAVAQGPPHGVVLADCDYGNKTAFRDALDTMGLQYAVEVQSTTMVSSCVGTPQWLLIEWPEGEPAPTKFVLSTMPKSTSCKQLVHRFKERWRIERSYEDLKGELGLDHYEGRSYIGWHHHVSVVLACYAFLVAEHARSFPPSARRTRDARSITNAV